MEKLTLHQTYTSAHLFDTLVTGLGGLTRSSTRGPRRPKNIYHLGGLKPMNLRFRPLVREEIFLQTKDDILAVLRQNDRKKNYPHLITLPIHNFFFTSLSQDLHLFRLDVMYGVCIPFICHRHHRRCLCKKIARCKFLQI